jgi:hypothetical protein
MNAREPITMWDRPVTDKELDSYYGKEESTEVRDEMIETITKTVLTVPVAKLGLPYVSTLSGLSKLAMYPLAEVITDYSRHKAPEAALIALFEKSTCPLVAAYRQALADCFADHNALEVEEFRK